MRWTAPAPHRLAAGAALAVQALMFVENFPFPWGLLLAAPALVLPWTRAAWRSPFVWGLIAFADAVPLVTRPLFVPNHHFLMTYVALAFCLAGAGEERARLLATNARWILAGVMALAVAQKLLAAGFPGYVGFMIATGGFVDPVLGRSAVAGALADNAARAAAFLASAPADGAAQVLRVPAGFGSYARGAAAAIVAVEGGLALLALLRPDRPLFHAAYLGFLGVLGFIRSELLFLSALAMLGLLISCARPSRWRWLYVALLLVALPAATLRIARSPTSLGEALDRTGLAAAR
jgi:hypothetical protein